MSEHNTRIFTGLDDVYGITTIYRNWGIPAAPDMCGWEVAIRRDKTIIWQGDAGNNAQRVIDFHQIIKNNFDLALEIIRDENPRDVQDLWDLIVERAAENETDN